MFEPSCMLIHILILNLNISIMTMLSPSKVNFSLDGFEVLRTYFSIWITNTFFVCNMVKHVSNILWRKHKNGFQKWKVMIIFYVYFVQNGTRTLNQEKWRLEKFKQNLLSFKNFFMSYYICSCSLNVHFHGRYPTF